KLISNPQDSVALLRVINTPARGIGKNTVETLERLALETGASLWSAMGEALERKLLPPRALAALKGFRELIDDARSMLAGTFVGRVSATTEPEPSYPRTETQKEPSALGADEAAFNPEDLGGNTAFDFGVNTDEAQENAPQPIEGFRTPGGA